MNTKHHCCVVHRAETPPTLDDHDHRWSFKSGMQNISLTVNPSHFTGINLSPICQFAECFSYDILSFEVYAALVVFVEVMFVYDILNLKAWCIVSRQQNNVLLYWTEAVVPWDTDIQDGHGEVMW